MQKQRKSSQTGQNHNSIVIKQSQILLVPSQGLWIIFWAICMMLSDHCMTNLRWLSELTVSACHCRWGRVSLWTGIYLPHAVASIHNKSKLPFHQSCLFIGFWAVSSQTVTFSYTTSKMKKSVCVCVQITYSIKLKLDASFQLQLNLISYFQEITKYQNPLSIFPLW